LTRLEGRVALARLFARHPGLSPATDPAALRRHSGLIMRGLHELPLRTQGPAH
jgi:hypothetical protein